jgi:hypothetical protein
MLNSVDIIKIKKAKPKHPIMDVLVNRFSPRHYSPEQVPDNVIDSLIEAARWAPSGRNIQPWHYYIIRKSTASYQKILTCIPERHWWVESAPLIILTSYIPKTENGEVNDFALYDLGEANFSIVMQALTCGYYCRQVAMFDHEKAVKLLDIDKNHQIWDLIAIGKIGNYSNATEQIVKLDSETRSRNDIISTELK